MASENKNKVELENSTLEKMLLKTKFDKIENLIKIRQNKHNSMLHDKYNFWEEKIKEIIENFENVKNKIKLEQTAILKIKGMLSKAEEQNKKLKHLKNNIPDDFSDIKQKVIKKKALKSDKKSKMSKNSAPIKEPNPTIKETANFKIQKINEEEFKKVPKFSIKKIVFAKIFSIL
ncbi:hypothetical protein MHBO_002760 [Bonamia ostreae]|uniref:Uncharacterized protein n=1 Tax=Bonamia ostreae TaxID=126728 RepID=A0ABV2ANE1_9EUKA